MDHELNPVLKTIRDRCHDTGSCWIWGQGVNSQGYPQMRINGKSGQLVRRIVVRESGRVLRNGYVVMARCGDALCCSPKHLIQVTKSDRLRRCYESGFRSLPVEYFWRRERAIKQGLAKINMTIAREIRAREGTLVALAAEYGLSVSAIREIKHGRAWRESAIGSSVFNQSI